MEGIFDGRAADDCFVCGLLWPELEACPRCERRMRWLSAELADDLGVMTRIARAWDSWRATGDRDWLERLLDDLHRFAPGSLDALAAVGGGLDQLRAAWADAAPALSPSRNGDGP